MYYVRRWGGSRLPEGRTIALSCLYDGIGTDVVLPLQVWVLRKTRKALPKQLGFSLCKYLLQ